MAAGPEDYACKPESGGGDPYRLTLLLKGQAHGHSPREPISNPDSLAPTQT